MAPRALDGVDRLEAGGVAGDFPRFRDATRLLAAPAALRREFDTHGYLFLAGLLPAATVLAVRRVVLDHCRAGGWLAAGRDGGSDALVPGRDPGDPDDAEWRVVLANVLADPALDALRDHAAIRAVLEALADGPVQSRAGDVLRVVPPGVAARTTPPHQDAQYIKADRLWTVWIPLGDCPPALGGLALLPGSHLRGLLPHGERGVTEPPADGWVTAHYRAGDALIFQRLTVHRALENRMPGALRLSVDFRFVPAPS